MPDEAWKDEQIEYYRRRAAEYDEWFLRLGRYDRGPEHRARWNREVEVVRDALECFAPRGDVLELAGGTGLWSERLKPHATRLTVVDASPEMLGINRARLGGEHVEYVRADLFDWQPEREHDVVFFSFWLSHVPPERFDAFWATVRRATGSAGRVFFCDSLFTPSSTASDHIVEEHATMQQRCLNDGSEFQVVKVYYRPEELETRLQRLGWVATVEASGEYFLYGTTPG